MPSFLCLRVYASTGLRVFMPSILHTSSHDARPAPVEADSRSQTAGEANTQLVKRPPMVAPLTTRVAVRVDVLLSGTAHDQERAVRDIGAHAPQFRRQPCNRAGRSGCARDGGAGTLGRERTNDDENDDRRWRATQHACRLGGFGDDWQLADPGNGSAANDTGYLAFKYGADGKGVTNYWVKTRSPAMNGYAAVQNGDRIVVDLWQAGTGGQTGHVGGTRVTVDNAVFSAGEVAGR